LWSAERDEASELSRRQGSLKQIGRAGSRRQARLITRRGKPMAQFTAVDVRRKRIDPSVLRAITDAMPMQPACGANSFTECATMNALMLE